MDLIQQTVSQSARKTNLACSMKTLSASNATAAVPIFRITGAVKILRLYGVVTTAIGSNHTAGYFRLNDQSAQTDITLQTVGVTLSSFAVGSVIEKTALAATLATVKNAATGLLIEPTVAQGVANSEFEVIAKNTANTDIEYRYTTTNTPTTGEIQFCCEWMPLSANAAVTAL